MEKPLVSIVTPSYQQEAYIEDTIRSVRKQEYDRIEHIVVDGGSTDGTVDILKEYEETYNLRWISEDDDGQSDAINKGFSMADGEIVGWINSDDFYYDSDVVPTAVDRFESEPELDVLYGGIAFIDGKGLIDRFQPSAKFAPTILAGHTYLPQPGVFFRSDVVKSEQLRTDLVFCMDLEYWLRLANEGYNFASTSKIMAAYRMHDEAKGPTLGDDTRITERESVVQEYNEPTFIEETSFKVLRNINELIFNLRNRSERREHPPIFQEDHDATI
ncbi:glycosyltransferase family 2 protein [Halostella salina]|uniref:glycosyltransferase family 2 protein n=1 Tax=Halostella salina TaxID=1547897 RepID=UPI0013CE918C|nr:glycosyltransferase family 2 protein [Halostella salina]